MLDLVGRTVDGWLATANAPLPSESPASHPKTSDTGDVTCAWAVRGCGGRLLPRCRCLSRNYQRTPGIHHRKFKKVLRQRYFHARPVARRRPRLATRNLAEQVISALPENWPFRRRHG